MTNPYALIDKVNQNKKWHAGDGECVAIAQWTLEMPNTTLWRPGVKVLGNEDYLRENEYGIGKTGIVRGAVIATFVDKMYQSKITGNHVAIYLEQTRDTITVIDQWVKRDKITHKVIGFQAPHKRILPRSTGYSNNAEAFSVVYTF